MACCICGRKDVQTPYDTPDDPPFFPAGSGNKHCEFCERWLQIGALDE